MSVSIILPLYIFLALPTSFSSCLSRCFSHPLTLYIFCPSLYLSLYLSVFLPVSLFLPLYMSVFHCHSCLSSSLSTCSRLTPSRFVSLLPYPSASLPVSLYLSLNFFPLYLYLFLHLWFSLPVSHPLTLPYLSILFLPVCLSPFRLSLSSFFSTCLSLTTPLPDSLPHYLSISHSQLFYPSPSLSPFSTCLSFSVCLSFCFFSLPEKKKNFKNHSSLPGSLPLPASFSISSQFNSTGLSLPPSVPFSFPRYTVHCLPLPLILSLSFPLCLSISHCLSLVLPFYLSLFFFLSFRTFFVSYLHCSLPSDLLNCM